MLYYKGDKQSASMAVETELPYYKFLEDEHELQLESRFWNCRGKQIAIVACITKHVDWAAYIGTDAPDSHTEDDTLKYVAKYGCKLSKEDAQYFFPEIKLPYRS